jgi:hypothetical protein
MEIKYNLAQCNAAKMRAPLTDPSMKAFADLLAPINQLADESPGFVWRLEDYEGNATAIRAYDDELILFNMSVWKSVEDLKNYTYKTAHAHVYRDRSQWFEKNSRPSYALWWIIEGHIPTIDEAKARLEHLINNGPSDYAFDFKHIYPPSAKTEGVTG